MGDHLCAPVAPNRRAARCEPSSLVVRFGPGGSGAALVARNDARVMREKQGCSPCRGTNCAVYTPIVSTADALSAELFCQDVMSRQVRTCGLKASASQCARIMKQFGVGFVPVVDDAGRIAGVITDRDLAVRVLGEGRSGKTHVEDVMSTAVVSCSPVESVSGAAEKMAATKKSRIVIVDHRGAPVGIIGLRDLARVEGMVGMLVRALVRRATTPVEQ